MTLRPVNNPAAGVAQRTRTGRHFSGMRRCDLSFVHLDNPTKQKGIDASNTARHPTLGRGMEKGHRR